MRTAPSLDHLDRLPAAPTVHAQPVGRRVISKSAEALGMTFVTLIFATPFLWMLFSSFKTTGDLFRYSYPLTWKTFIPPSPTLANYESIFVRWHFGRNLLNSLVVSSAQVAATLIICSLAAFVFARLRFRGRDLLFGLVMLTALIPFEVNMIPLFVVVRSLNIQDSYAAVFLPWIASPFGIFLLRQSFIEIPHDLDDAATVDGASLLQIFWNVTIPSARPALVTLAMMSFLWSWNAFLWPLIVIQNPTKQLIQVAVATFTVPQELPAWGEIFAASSIATIPVLILFIALQRYYIRGVVLSGVKG